MYLEKVTEFAEVVSLINAAAFAAIGALSVRQWRRSRLEPARWLAVAFGLLGAVAAFGVVIPEDPQGVVALTLQRVLVLGIVAYAWALVRFLVSFETIPVRLARTVAAWSVAVAVGLLALPYLPGSNDVRPWWFQAWILAFMLQWSGLHFLVARRLWTASRSLTSVARHRARSLSIGAIFLAIALLPSAAAGPPERSVLAAIVQLLPTATALFFYLGYLPPVWLRNEWRRREVGALREATIELMSVADEGRIAEVLLPHAVRMVGGRAASLIDDDGTVIGSYRSDASESQSTTLIVPVGGRRLEIEAGPYTPFFGQDETSLLQSLGAFIDIAIERSRAVKRETTARHSAEELAAELETLVFGLSHDLKSPIIALTGYLDYLEEDYAPVLGDEGRFFLGRMRLSATYMQQLINDLLELSRVGRAETEAEPIALEELVLAVADRVLVSAPDVSVVAVPPLPVVSANPVRMQQLFSNLIENAVAHGGRDDITIRVSATTDADWCRITVADDGEGIPAQFREQVFGIFERLDASAGDARGTGVGLAMCRRIAVNLGGSLTLADSATGACFVCTVPSTIVAWEDGRPGISLTPNPSTSAAHHG